MRPLHQGAQDLGTLKQIIFVPIPLSLFQTFGAGNFYSLEAISFHFQCLPLFFVCGRFILVFRFRIAVRPFSLSHSSVRSLLLRFLHTQHSSAVFHFLRHDGRVTEVGGVPHKCSKQKMQRPSSVSASMTDSLRRNKLTPKKLLLLWSFQVFHFFFYWGAHSYYPRGPIMRK